jgi:hypothetical protein
MSNLILLGVIAILLFAILAILKNESIESKAIKEQVADAKREAKYLMTEIEQLKQREQKRLDLIYDLEKKIKDVEYEALKPKTLNLHAPKPIPVLIGIRGVKTKNVAEDIVIKNIKEKLNQLDA